MTSTNIYAGLRIYGEGPEKYHPGGFHPIYLGDVLDGRYHIFRKLGSGSQSTVWLARDSSVSETARFVAVKVFDAESGKEQVKLDQVMQPLSAHSHPGQKYVEKALGSFMLEGPNGSHYCKVLEPMGKDLAMILERVEEERIVSNMPEFWLGRALKGDSWSVRYAKRICWQLLSGLDYLHSQKIAHRDIRPHNVLSAFQYDLSSLSENEIQREVWNYGEVEAQEAQEHGQDDRVDEDDEETDEDNEDLDDDEEGGRDSAHYSVDEEAEQRQVEWQQQIEERRKHNEIAKRFIQEKWETFESGDKLAIPHSIEWNKANFINSRDTIGFIVRTDGQPLNPSEAQYTVAPTALSYDLDFNKPIRVLLGDLGFSCTFDQCDIIPIITPAAFMPPEAVLDMTTTHKADIFSMGLLCWQTVMIEHLVYPESFAFDEDPGTVPVRKAYGHIRDLAGRLGPLPPELRARLDGKYSKNYIDDSGKPLGLDAFDPGEFRYGNIWDEARLRKPLDMSESDLEIFVGLIKDMLQWSPESRPSTSQLLQHEWFKDLEG